MEWLNNIAGPQYASAVLWTVGALVLLVIVLFLIRVVRGSSGAFVAGGRNRRARLAIMDAAAVDNQRRLVLVRRDDVEHLILIGGPTDVVVEQNIVPGAALHRPPNRTESESPNGRASIPMPKPPATGRPDAPHRERQEPFVTEPPAPRAPEISSAKAERPEPVLASEPQASVSARPHTEPSTAPSGSVHFLDKSRPGPAQQVAGATAAVFPVSGIEADERRTPEITMPEREASAPETVRDETGRKVESFRREPRGGIDAALSEELKEPLLAGDAEPRQGAEPSLEDEMKRLLGELSMPARS